MASWRSPAGEAVVPYPKPPETIAPAKSWRSTWVISSIQSLKERGLYPTYERLLPPEHRDTLVMSVAGMWMPMDVAAAHYATCERLPLSNGERVEIGAAATSRVQGTVLKTVVALAKTAGVTPWALLAQAPRLWERAADGGGIAVFKVGPKEAIIEAIGCALFEIPYFRAAFTGVVLGVARLAATAYARELPAPSASTYRGRFQWA